MGNDQSSPAGPDLAQGIPISQIPVGGMLAGHVDGEVVLLARLADGFHAVEAFCTHYGGPLAKGLLVGDEVRCPWHHACFSVRTGAALKAPAFSALGVWRVEVVGDEVFVRAREEAPASSELPKPADAPGRIVIVGAGAAGFAAAVRLRDLGYQGSITMLGRDDSAPYDRPNLSKDYLAGTAPEEWMPLRDADFYASHRIELRTGCEVTAVDPDARLVRTSDGEDFGYDRLLFATGALPRPVPIPGFDHPSVLSLRTLADAHAVIERCGTARRVVLLGAGFIGMEVAAALRRRGLDVVVLEMAEVPLQKVLGDDLGRFLVRLHEAHGVTFHLGVKVEHFDGEAVVLGDGTRVEGDFVIAGIGVVPDEELARQAGFAVDKGILVDDRLQASIPGHYAAGDVARYPWKGKTARVEHWVHAERMGQAAAANMLGADQPFLDVPFFWTQQHGVSMRYCGLGVGWDDVRIDGDLDGRHFTARYYQGRELVAAASVGRDLENLQIEEELQRAHRP